MRVINGREHYRPTTELHVRLGQEAAEIFENALGVSLRAWVVDVCMGEGETSPPGLTIWLHPPHEGGCSLQLDRIEHEEDGTITSYRLGFDR